MHGGVLTEIGSGKTLHGFAVVAASVGGIAAAFGVAAQPIESVDGATADGIFAQEDGDFFVGVGLVLQISDPGNAPLGVVGILPAGISNP